MREAPLPDALQTPRLTLRCFREEDVERFIPLIGDREVARWLARVPFPYGVEDGRSWVALTARNRASRAALDLLAVRTEDRQPVGGVTVTLEDGELGYWLGRPFQGSGYAAEMARAVLRVAFADLRLPTLWAATDPDNTRSRRLLERLGFRPDGGAGHLPRYDLTADRWRTLTEESA